MRPQASVTAAVSASPSKDQTGPAQALAGPPGPGAAPRLHLDGRRTVRRQHEKAVPAEDERRATPRDQPARAPQAVVHRGLRQRRQAQALAGLQKADRKGFDLDVQPGQQLFQKDHPAMVAEAQKTVKWTMGNPTRTIEHATLGRLAEGKLTPWEDTMCSSGHKDKAESAPQNSERRQLLKTGAVAGLAGAAAAAVPFGVARWPAS